MKLRELNIKNFGKFNNHSIRLEDGINLIYGDNEAGKSTIHSFIRCMLFGLRKQRGRASRTDLYNQYEPRENPSFYAGTLRFESGGKIFRLERNFSRENLRSELVCETDGERLSIEDGDLKMLLGGISRSIYDNTVSVGQMKSKTDEELTRALRNYMANYQGDADQETNLEEALRSLKAKKKEQEQKRDVHRHRLEVEEKQLHSRMDYVQEELNHKIDNLEQTKEQCKKEMYYREVPRSEVNKASRKRSHSRKWMYTCLTIAVLLTVLCIAQFFRVSRLFVRAGLSVAIIALIWAAVKIWKHSHENRLEVPDDQENYIRKLQWNVDYLQNEINEQKMMLEDMQGEEQEIQKAMTIPSGYEEEIEAIEIAMQVIADIAITMQQEISHRLKQKISEILYDLTGGRYRHVTMNHDFEIELHTDDSCVSLYQVSSGTVEQVYFALRMAVMDILCREEEMPIILDEVFAMYDEKRLMRALQWVHENRGQVLLFTCHDREERLLDRMGIPYHKVMLEGVNE